MRSRTARKTPDRRASCRDYFPTEAALRWGEFKETTVILLDVSTTGALFTSYECFLPGDAVQLAFPDGQSIDACVVRSDGIRTACEFAAEIDQSALDEILKFRAL